CSQQADRQGAIRPLTGHSDFPWQKEVLGACNTRLARYRRRRFMFPDSSAVELSTVNRAAVGSNPTRGATIFRHKKTKRPGMSPTASAKCVHVPGDHPAISSTAA